MEELFSQAFVGALAAGSAILWYRYGRPQPATRPGEASSYGSGGTSRFGRPQELRRYLKQSGAGFIFGRELLIRRPIWSRNRLPPLLILPGDPKLPYNQNVTVIGPSGSRKTRSVVEPNILQAAQFGHESMIVIDPKGENFARSASILRAYGFEVYVVNLEHPEHSDFWNCLDTVTTVTSAADLAVNLVANTINPNRPRSGDPFWDNAEQAFITALVLYIKRHRPPEEQHMASVLELGTDLSPDALDAVFLALPRNDPARRYYRSFLRAEDKIRAGVIAGLGSRLQLWNSPEIAQLTSVSSFSLAEFGSKKSALFLIIPDSKSTFTPLLALFWQQAFETLYQTADKHGGRLPLPVRCLMDEIANCGFIPDYEKKKSTMRSRGISTVEIWQNLTQMENRYPSWEELLANSDHLLVLGANDLKTAKYVSNRLGMTTVRVHGSNSSASTHSSSSGQSENYTARPLMTPDEVFRLPSDEALLLPRGTYPARIVKADFTEHPLAGEIQMEDHKAHQAPSRPPAVITDVAALWSATQRRAPQPGAGDQVKEQPPVDPLDFLDTDHRENHGEEEGNDAER